MVDCPITGTVIFIHAGHPSANSCQWCLDHIGKEYEGKEEPYALPAHEKCQCYWKHRYERRGLTWFNYNQVEKLLDNAKREIKTEDEWKAEDARLQQEALVEAETAQDNADTAIATAEDYGTQAEVAEYNYGVQLGLMNEALAVRDAQQALMDAALADAALHQGEADAAEASMNSYQDIADAAEANYDACQATITEYLAIQAEQQALMDAADAAVQLHQGEASAAHATELEYQDDLDAANIEYSGVEDEIQEYLDIQAAQQAIIDAAEANIATQQGLADAASASETALNASAAAYLEDYNATLATIAEYEAIQATQQGLMDTAASAQAADEASCAEYEDQAAVHNSEAASWLDDYNAAFAQYEDYTALADQHSADMSYWLGEYNIADDEADAAYQDNVDFANLATECYATAADWYDLADYYYSIDDQVNGDRCQDEADAAWDLGVAADQDAADAYDLYEIAVARMNECSTAYNTCLADRNADLTTANDWATEANTCSANYNAALAEAAEDQATADDFQDQADAHQAEWDAAKVIYDAHDTATLEIEAADLLDCYNEDHALALAAHADYEAAIAAIAGYQATIDAAQIIYDAHDTAQLYAELAEIQGRIDIAQAGVTQYHNLYVAALAAAQIAMEDYTRAEAIFNAHDTEALVDQLAEYLADQQAAEAQVAIYLDLWETAIAAAEAAIAEYDVAAAIYAANEENITQISVEMAWQLAAHDQAIIQQDYWTDKAAEYVAQAEAAMDTYETLGSDFEERHEVSAEDQAYIDRLEKCLEFPIVGDDSATMKEYYDEKYSSNYF